MKPFVNDALPVQSFSNANEGESGATTAAGQLTPIATGGGNELQPPRETELNRLNAF
jgi:hypothetical protein